MIVFHEAMLYSQIQLFTKYYHKSRTHLSLGKDSPTPRKVQPPEVGRVIAFAQVGGLHHLPAPPPEDRTFDGILETLRYQRSLVHGQVPTRQSRIDIVCGIQCGTEITTTTPKTPIADTATFPTTRLRHEHDISENDNPYKGLGGSRGNDQRLDGTIVRP